MGFFSFECKGCGESIKATGSAPVDLIWQTSAMVKHDGAWMRGAYDGYGRVAGVDIADGIDPIIWHTQCYRRATKSERANETPCKSAADQGYFY